MFNRLCAHVVYVLLILVHFSVELNAAEYLIESDIVARTQYTDNIFLRQFNEISVSSVVINPGLKAIIREKSWETFLEAEVTANRYSDDTLDSNDVFFDVLGKYTAERNIYSLAGSIDFDSNLNSDSADFGIASRRINRETITLTPQFSRMLTERLLATLALSYSGTSYDETVDTGFVSYSTLTLSNTLVYNVSENDQLNLVLQVTSYESDDGLFEYDIAIGRAGMNHQLSETFLINYNLGASRRNSTSRPRSFTFFGQTITPLDVVDSENTGVVVDAGFKKQWARSSLEGGLSRDNNTDSFGGLNEVDILRLTYFTNIDRLWSLSIRTNFNSTISVNASNQFADRETITFESILKYKISRDWFVDASYRYLRREFVSSVSSQVPDSNRFYVGLKYNFPSLSTF